MPDEPVTKPAPLLVLRDNRDDAAFTRCLLAGNNPAAGRITVHPTPNTASAATLAHDILTALGHSIFDLSGQQVRTMAPAWRAVHAWLDVRAINTLIVLRAHRLSAENWGRLLQLRDDIGLQRLVMVCHGPLPKPVQALLNDTPHTNSSEPGDAIEPAANLPPEPDDPLREVPDQGPLREVPALDMPGFLAAAWRSLPRDDFQRLHTVYQYGRDAACRWVASVPEYLRDHHRDSARRATATLFPRMFSTGESDAFRTFLETKYPDPHTLAQGLLCIGNDWSTVHERLPVRIGDRDALHVLLSGLVYSSPDRRHTVALLRGAQAGLFLHGLHLVLPRDLTVASGPGMTGLPTPAELGARLETATCNPMAAAALAITLFTGLAPGDLTHIYTSHFAADATHFHLAPPDRNFTRTNVAFAVPAAYRNIFGAARTFANLTGGTGQRLISTGNSPMGNRIAHTAAALRITLPALGSYTNLWLHETTAHWVGSSIHHVHTPRKRP